MKNAIFAYLKAHPPALELFNRLAQSGNIYLIGGVLREFLDHGTISNLRDIDIIVDIRNRDLWNETLTKYALRCNRFGGYKLVCDGLLIDTWPVEQTWAFREKIINCSPNEYISMLPETVFLNIDGIIYDWTQEKWEDTKYRQALASKTLDVVLAPNPQVLLNIVRTFVLKHRYSLCLSSELKRIIREEFDKSGNIDCFVDSLMVEQNRRYQSEIISKASFLLELNNII